ncbi:MAG: hypothetical protein R2762_01230 [Bryobacteraceae bacterium]
MLSPLDAPLALHAGKLAPGPKPESPVDAAQQFEALLVGQLLREARKGGGGGWLSSGDDQAADTMIEFAEEQIARALTSAGGLGLSRMIEAGLVTAADTANATQPPDGADPGPKPPSPAPQF